MKNKLFYIKNKNINNLNILFNEKLIKYILQITQFIKVIYLKNMKKNNLF